MPLLDHFHPPLFGRRHWEAFHGRWAAAMSDALNEVLPSDYFAEFQTTLGSQIEVDVATFTEAGPPTASPDAPYGPVLNMPGAAHAGHRDACRFSR